MTDFTERTSLLIGQDGVEKLKNSSVLIFGLGGVGGNCADAIVRAGVGVIGVADGDRFDVTNLNRQLLALRSNVGLYKTDVFEQRAKDINPDAMIKKYTFFFGHETDPENEKIDFENYDVIIDCIDDVKAKTEIVKRANELGKKVIVMTGTGKRMSPPLFIVKDLFKTEGDPLARALRRNLRKEGINSGVLCVVSADGGVAADPDEAGGNDVKRRKIPVGSISYVPGAAGYVAAGAAINLLLAGN